MSSPRVALCKANPPDEQILTFSRIYWKRQFRVATKLERLLFPSVLA